jgi:hypothetical protein
MAILFISFFRKSQAYFIIPRNSYGFIPFIGALLVAGYLLFFGWKDYWFIRNTTIYLMDLHTMDAYIAAFVLLSLAICFLFTIDSRQSYYESYVAIVLWILINGAIAFRLQGRIFNYSVFLALFIFWRFIVTKINKI